MAVLEENAENDTTWFESYLHSRITVGFFIVMLVILLTSGYGNNYIHCTPAKYTDVSPTYVESKCWVNANGLKLVTTDHLHETKVTAPKSLNSSEPDDTHVLEFHKWFKEYLAFQCLFLLLPHWLWFYFTENSFMFGFNYLAKMLIDVIYIAYAYVQFNFLHGRVGAESVLDFHWWDKIVHSFSGTIVLPNLFPRNVMCSLNEYQKLMVNYPTAENFDQGDYHQYKTLIEEEFQCVLPQSSINEKIFLTVWVWLLMLLVISCTCFVWKIFTMIPLRRTRMLARSWMCPAVRLVKSNVCRQRV